MTRLSVNINKIATLRNARGGNLPNLLQVAKDCETFGADGITVHPRPDERHIRYQDVIELADIVSTEFNIEGNPNSKFIALVKNVKPAQVTLVPDADNALTSNHGWDTIKHNDYLTEVIAEFKSSGIRTSIFIDPIEQFIEAAKQTGVDRIELYTGPFAHTFQQRPEESVQPFSDAAKFASQLGLGVNAGHDLNLDNLYFFKSNVSPLHEVSIGHALISDALYFGLENVINMYKHQLNR